MGYRPRKRNAVVQLRPRNISYEESGRTITLLSMNRDNMDLEVEIKEGNETKILADFPFAHLPKKIKKEINPL
ncbi:MAG: hypothetical protein JHC35_02060 [Sulfuricurvum sp.]|jgi:pheromone shutdown protein TraB|uniref:hypothetical protein n=1 Tax=Sulfuricurvum sp. TaxID=2025608 RepID=UPI0025D0A14A|nr:hypothetical protein [Sulfuricurvum sp.]MCI4406054.1 hypothetical protein [Sulfuricurvum sp.]